MYNQKPLLGTLPNYAHPLTPTAAWIMNEGSGNKIYDIINRNHGAFGAGAAAPSWVPEGLNFDGNNDYVNIPHNSSIDIGTENITVLVWFKSSTSVTGSRVFNKGGAKRYEIVISLTNFIFVIDDDVTKSSVSISSSGYFDGNWHFLVAQRDYGNLLKIKIDNGNWATAADNTGDISNTVDAQIGTSEFFGSEHWSGLINKIFLYNTLLRDPQISQLYHNSYCWLAQPFSAELMYAAPPVSAIMNQFQRAKLGADLYDGVLIT